MKSKSMILMFVSLGFGLIAAIGISQVMGKNSNTAESTMKMVPVLVAVDHLDLNSPLTAENVKIDHWPVNIVPEECASNLEEIENMAITARVAKGMPILQKDLIPKGKVTRLPIPDGFKVVAIKVSADDTINGLLAPGDRVDVIGVFKTREDGATVSVSKMFLKNIQVFSVDDSFNVADRPRMESGGSKSNAIVAVLLNERQSEQLVLVQKVAQLKLVLRGNSSADGDESDMEDMDEELEKYINNRGPEVEEDEDSSPYQYTSVEKGFTQKVWNGSDMVEYEHGKDGEIKQKGGTAVPFGSTNNAGSADQSGDTDIDSDLEEDQYPGE